MKNKINGITSMLFGIATAFDILAGFPAWVLVSMAVITGLFGLIAGYITSGKSCTTSEKGKK